MKFQYSFLLTLIYLNPAVADYTENTHTAIQLLQDKYYNVDTGLWKGTNGDMWWQSGHIVETIARFGIADESYKQTAIDIIANTYAKSGDQIGYTDWHNDYYDDMGWWAQGWIAAYDLTGDAKYLDTAKDLFEDMTGGYHTPCGGIFWNKDAKGIASISNELFLSVGAHLANRVGDNEKENYKNWAQQEWDFIWNSGVINGDNLINDGVDMTTCKNNGESVFTYNQGVVLAGLSELAKAFSDGGFTDVSFALSSTPPHPLPFLTPHPARTHSRPRRPRQAHHKQHPCRAISQPPRRARLHVQGRLHRRPAHAARQRAAAGLCRLLQGQRRLGLGQGPQRRRRYHGFVPGGEHECELGEPCEWD
jgi:hypothetical protein